MSKGQPKTAPKAATTVNVNDAFELKAWAFYFQATEQQVKDCVKRVGTRVKNVRRCLETAPASDAG